MGIHARFALANRAQIEDEIERLVELLDMADAPAEDLEPEEDHAVDDKPCDAGPEDFLPVLPVYGIDQSRGPMNEREGRRSHHARLMAG